MWKSRNTRIIHIQFFIWASWPCDSTPLQYFLSDDMTSQVYSNNPQSIPELNNEIIRVFSEEELQLCQNFIELCRKRARAARRDHLTDIIFLYLYRKRKHSIVCLLVLNRFRKCGTKLKKKFTTGIRHYPWWT